MEICSFVRWWINKILLNRFYIEHNKKNCYDSVNPFLKKINKKIDPRISVLYKYINDVINNPKLNYKYEKQFILFWDKLEKKNGNKYF